jgi:hypothetical protein
VAMDRRHCPLGGYSTPNDSSVKMGVRSGSLRTSRPALGSPIAGYARSHFGQKNPDSTELGRLLGYRGRRRPRMRASGSRAIERLQRVSRHTISRICQKRSAESQAVAVLPIEAHDRLQFHSATAKE